MILTLFGMWQYNPKLFDDIRIDNRIEKNLLLTYIMEFAGNNEIRCPEPTILKNSIDTFFKSRQDNYKRMLDALTAEYSPIENYDRKEDRQLDITKDSDIARNGGEDYKDVNSSTIDSSDNITSSKNGANENTQSAFNATTYQPLSKTTNDETGTSDSTTKSTTNGTFEHSANFINKEVGNEKQGHKEILHAHGNIGVTTNQEMIRQEIELRKLNVYEMIALEFEDAITIPVY